MKHEQGSCKTATAASPRTGHVKVSIQAIYAEAMRDVMADPRKAIAEYDPGLATLLNRGGAAAAAKN